MNQHRRLIHAALIVLLGLTVLTVPAFANQTPDDFATSTPLEQALAQGSRDLIEGQLHLDQVEHTLSIVEIVVEETSARVDVSLQTVPVFDGLPGEPIDEVIHVFALLDGQQITALFREPSPDFYTYAGQVSTHLLPPERLQFWEALRAQDLASTPLSALGDISPQAVSYYLPWATGDRYYVYQDWNKHFDFQLPVGTPVWASRGGTAYVYRASVDKTECATPDIYNNYVRITHSDGSYGWYLHFKFGSIQVNTNDYIYRGQALAQSGNTGCSFGAHLHFNVSTASGNAGGDPYGSAWLVVSFVEGAIPTSPSGGKTPPSQNTLDRPTPPPNSVTVRPTLYYNNAVVSSPSMCGNYWYPINGAYLTLNTNIAAQSTNYARWSAALDKPGIYKVEAYVRNHPVVAWQCPAKTISYDTADARYTIYTSGGNVSVTGNQRPLSDSWLDLGNHSFDPGSAARARLVDLNGEANATTSISVHDMRFTLVQETCFNLALASSPASGGVISASPAPNCNGTQYSYNTLVTLTAYPEDGYIFIGWSGSASGSSATTTVTMSANRSVSASFSPRCYSVSTSASPAAGGSIQVSPAPNCGAQYTHGTQLIFTAQPAQGYAFSAWSGDVSGASNPAGLTLTAAAVVQAVFSAVPPAVPGAFQKLAPANLSGDRSSTVLLDWSDSSGASSYEYCLVTLPSQPCPAWDSTAGSSYAQLSGLAPGATYYWQVRARNSAGLTYANASASNFWSFTVRPPGAPDMPPRQFFPLTH